MPCFYLTPKQDDFDKIPALQVCIAEALYDAEAVLSNPSAFEAEEIRTLRDQITSNLERAWEITGRSEDELTGVMVQISQVVARQFKIKRSDFLASLPVNVRLIRIYDVEQDIVDVLIEAGEHNR